MTETHGHVKDLDAPAGPVPGCEKCEDDIYEKTNSYLIRIRRAGFEGILTHARAGQILEAEELKLIAKCIDDWRELGLGLWEQFASYHDADGERAFSNMGLSVLDELEGALEGIGKIDHSGFPRTAEHPAGLPESAQEPRK